MPPPRLKSSNKSTRHDAPDPDDLPPSPEERRADKTLAIPAGHIPRTMTPEQHAELKGHAFYLVARLRDIDNDQAAAMLVRGFALSLTRAKECLKAWKKKTDAIVEGADRRWLQGEMVAIFEASRARSMMLDAFTMEFPTPESMAASRDENKFQLALGEKIVGISEKIGAAGEDDEAVERAPAALEVLMDTAKRLADNQSVTVTQSVRVDNHGG